jgi:hypothetical protein
MIALILFLSGVASICISTQDRIAHYDNVGNGFWSRDAYWKAKYRFMVKYPKVPKWFVLNFLVMFLDAWHFCRLVSLLCFFGMIALFSIKLAIIGFCMYQLFFLTFYQK